MSAALVEPVALAVHLEDMNVVGEPVEQRPGEALERTSLDFYAALRSLYRQRRADEIRNSKPTAVEPAPGISSPAAPGDGTAALPGQP